MNAPLQSLDLRRAIVRMLRADGDLSALGSPPLEQRIYGRRQPDRIVWPFLRVSIITETPTRSGTTARLTVHSFSKGEFDDEIETINAAVQAALGDATVALDDDRTAFMLWRSSQVIPDAAEASAWHGLNDFDALVEGACEPNLQRRVC